MKNVFDEIENLLIEMEIAIETGTNYSFYESQLKNKFSVACKMKGKENKQLFECNFIKFNNLLNFIRQ